MVLIAHVSSSCLMTYLYTRSITCTPRQLDSKVELVISDRVESESRTSTRLDSSSTRLDPGLVRRRLGYSLQPILHTSKRCMNYDSCLEPMFIVSDRVQHRMCVNLSLLSYIVPRLLAVLTVTITVLTRAFANWWHCCRLFFLMFSFFLLCLSLCTPKPVNYLKTV